MIEKISDNEYLVTGNSIEDRKFAISKPTSNYRVEVLRKCSQGHFGRILSQKGQLRYFSTKEKAIEFISRQDFSKD